MTDFERALRADVYCHSGAESSCEGCVLNGSGEACTPFIYEQYSKYLENIEKEPAASVENCTDSSEDVDVSISSFPDYDDITNSKKCQVISGAQMFEFLAAMLVQRLEKGFVITEIEAYGLSCEMKFKYGDEVYGLTFTNETRADDVD